MAGVTGILLSGSMPTLSPSAASAGICTARKRGWEQSKVKASLTFKTVCVCMCAQLYPTLCHVMDCSPPGSSVHGISQVRRRVGCHLLLQGIFLTQGLKPRLLCLLHSACASSSPAFLMMYSAYKLNVIKAFTSHQGTQDYYHNWTLGEIDL